MTEQAQNPDQPDQADQPDQPEQCEQDDQTPRQVGWVSITEDGTITIPAEIMTGYVKEAVGCKLWRQDVRNRFGLKLATEMTEGIITIERVPGGEAEETGLVRAGIFLTQSGISFEPGKRYEAYFDPKNNFLEIPLGDIAEGAVYNPFTQKNVLDDYIPLEDF